MDNHSLKYPLLEPILVLTGTPLQPMYTIRDVAKIFQVCVRAIQNWAAVGKLRPRNLPGRWKFFPQDIEDFLTTNRKGER